MKPAQIIACQLDLVRRAEPVFTFHLWKSWYAQDQRFIRHLMNGTSDAIRSAAAYRVSDEMTTLIQFAASQLDSSDRWDVDLAPTPSGLVRFDTPLRLRDIDGKTQLAHWVLWGPLASADGVATLVYLFNDHDEPDEIARQYLVDPLSREGNELMGRWGSVHGEVMVQGGELGPETRLPHPSTVAELLASGRPVTAAANAVRYVHALWLLLGQSITETEGEHVRSTTRKMAGRAGVAGSVTVVRLRRGNASRGKGESSIEWTRRWVVRGHWRWQPYGAGRELRRRLWIDPYTKGPDDKPLIVSPKVYDVR